MNGRWHIYRTVNFMLRSLLTVIVFLLFLHSIFSTSFIGRAVNANGDLYGKTLNIPDSPWKHLIVFLLLTVLCAVVYRLFQKLKARGEGGVFGRLSENRFLLLLSFIFAGIGVLWVAVTQLSPGSDPAKIYAIALQWRAGDFSAFEEGNYLFSYPFQSGIVLFYYLLTFLFGTESYVGPQLINIAALAVIYLLLSLLARFYWKEDRKISCMVYPALMCWAPLFFYVTYIYGILPGMACAVGALYLAARYLETRRYRYMAGASLCIGIATVLKMNCLIYLVAIACFMLYDALDIVLSDRKNAKDKQRKWLSSVGFILLMGVGVWGCNTATELFVEHLSGYAMPEGEPMISWAVMGLQEAPKGPGDYNGYIGEVYTASGYDAGRAAEQSLADLRKILDRMLDEPIGEGLCFFAGKTAYQWNDPTFISMERMRNRKSAVEISPLVRSVIDGRGSVVLSVLLNYAQTLIWAGILLYLFFSRNSRNLYELMGAVVFLGGYLFHLVWEAGASYTIPYFVLMIPYAVKGFRDWTGAILRIADAARRHGMPADRSKMTGKTVLLAAAFLVIALAALRVGRSRTFHNTIALDDGQEAVQQYYHRAESD